MDVRDKDRIADSDTRETDAQTVVVGGGPAPRRIATPEAADEIYKQFKLGNVDEARRRATLQGMIDGNPPYDPAELEELGLAHVCNVNFLSMRATLDARASAAHELFLEVPTLIECKPKSPAQTPDDTERFRWCDIISEEFSQAVLDWDGFLVAMDLVVRESDAYGLGVAAFPDEWDWRFKAYRRGNLLMDAEARVDIDENEVFMFRDSYSAAELYQIIEDEEASRSRGWKVAKLKDLLVSIFLGNEDDESDVTQTSTWESLQHMVRTGDSTFQSKQFVRVKVVHILVREVSGERKISHLIIPEDEMPGKMFLLEAHDKYEKMSHALWWLPFNYGDGYARSVRGIASFMAQHDDLGNRFLCRAFDAGFLSASLLLQPQTQQDLSRLQFMQHGPYTVLPPELKAVQSTFQPQMAPLLQLRQVSENVMKNNTGLYRQHNESVVPEAQKTARQVVEETSKEARYEKAAIAHRYSQLDKLYREMMRRMFRKEVIEGDAPYPGKDIAKSVLDRCEKRGVDKKFIYEWQDNIRVRATRAIGMGSVGVKYDITAQIYQVSGAFDEVGKRQALRDFIAARVGQDNTDKYVGRLNRDQIPSNETSHAMLEWNDISEGAQVIVGSDQLHLAHISVFINNLTPLIQAVETGQPVGDPTVAYRTMFLALQHVEAHLQMLAQDPRRKDEVKQITEFLKGANGTLGKLKSAAENMMRQQQQAQQAQQQKLAEADEVLRSRDLEAKMFEIQQKYQVESAKQVSLNEMRRIKTEEQMDISRTRAADELRRKGDRQIAEIEMDRAKAQAEIELKRQKAGA